MVSYTPRLKLTQPDFDQTPWDEDINNDLAIIDATVGQFIPLGSISGVWKNSTQYLGGVVVVDPVDSTMWTCLLDHISPASPTTFAQDRTAHPTRWTSAESTAESFAQQAAASAVSAANSAAAAANKVSKFGDIMTGDLTVPKLHMSGSGGSITSDATYVYNIFASDGWQWRYTRASGALAYVRGTDATSLFAINFEGDTTALGQAQAHSFITTVSYAGITADANYSYFLMDSAGWQLRYNRSTGDLRYIRGSDAVSLFAIDSAGDTTALGQVQAHSFLLTTNYAGLTADANYTYILMDFAGWQLKYDRNTGSLSYVRGSDGVSLFSIDANGNVIAKGTITPSGTPLITLEDINDKLDALITRVAALEAKVP